ncbi:A disintegrin and metalloproteinase with thrombospondin motifs 7-like isoform X2 [Mercenaria mercenaria]|nr:A disintegrin and metalloproteinase with thrombospondin motifs 7-like isoform X2 [Mercenaria mercenaria]
MDFNVSLESGQTISLHLKLNRKQIGKVLVKVISENGVEFFDNTKPKDYAFYQVNGEDHSAAVMVRCEKFQNPCYIAGSFYHNGVEYLIDPDTDVAHMTSSIPHTVYKVNPRKSVHSYDHDTVQVVADSSVNSNQGKRNRPSNFLSNLLKLHHKERTKRQTTQKNYKIELEMVVADDVYTFWFSRMSQNRDAALEKIEEYFEQVANMMDLRFSTATTTNMTIDVVPLIITVIQDQSNNSWIANNIVNVDSDGNEAYHAEEALDDLYAWASENRDQNADALVCFSRRDMWSYGQQSGSDTAGIARFLIDNLEDQNPESSLCTNHAVSLVEVFRDGDSSATAAHELAHNMGIKHDVDYNDTACLDEKLYIMAGTLGFVSTAEDANNPWYFSSCSVSEMDRLMSTVTVVDGKTCLERHSYAVNEYNTIRTSDLLGEIFSLDEQCKLLNGEDSYHCNNTIIAKDEICWRGLLCKSKHNDYCDYKTPLPGSSCGGTKKCYRGECVNALPAVVTETPPSTVSQSSKSTMSQTTSATTSATSTTITPSTSTSKQSQTTSPSSTVSTAAASASLTSTTSIPTTTSIKSSLTTSASTTSTDSSTTHSTTSTTTSAAPSSTTSATDAYTEEEYDWLYYFYSECGSSCSCWRTYCWWYNQVSLCTRFAGVCYA